MPTQKQKRQRNAHAARLAAMAAKRKQAQRKRLAVAIVTVSLLVLGISVFVSGGGDGERAQTITSTTVAVTGVPVSLVPVGPGETITGDTPCPKADGTSARTTTFAKPPPMCIVAARTYAAEVKTSKGNFVIALDARAAPNTVNNFVVLARYKFYENVPFHRIIPGFVVQGGDPTATGQGSPGYRLNDEGLANLPRPGAYKIGSVAMANSGRNTNGSQFFVVTGDAGLRLDPSYSLFGQVTEGLEVVKAIERVGTASGQPTEAVTIQSVNIRET